MEEQLKARAAQSETLLQQITRTYYELLPTFERHMGVTRARWHLLKQLDTADALSQTELQQRAGVDAAAVTRQVKQLEEDGLVSRRVDPRDNRFTLVSLTREGQQRVAGLIERRAQFEAQVMAGIDLEEIQAIQRGLSRIRANLAAFSKAADSPAQALSGAPAGQAPE